MIERGVARKLTSKEIEEWQGHVFYICHLAVKSPKSNSTPIRIVFNSSQTNKGVSLNSILAKGPDSYRNSSLGILLRWREEPVALVGDIRKMFHSIFLEPKEQHCHRFLWRDLDQERKPDIYVMERVNMGDRPAPAIATEALFMTAELSRDSSPEAARFIQRGSYVDDLIDSVQSVGFAKNLTKQTEEVLAKGNFSVKCWQISGENIATNSSANELKGNESYISVLGVRWDPNADEISFEFKINFFKKKTRNTF